MTSFSNDPDLGPVSVGSRETTTKKQMRKMFSKFIAKNEKEFERAKKLTQKKHREQFFCVSHFIAMQFVVQ